MFSLQPAVTEWNALFRNSIVHIVQQIRDHERERPAAFQNPAASLGNSEKGTFACCRHALLKLTHGTCLRA